jgi:inosine-uridine nucleoside N-ribohydrolase
VVVKDWLFAHLLCGNPHGQPPNVRIPDESPGIKAVVQTLISAFDHVDIVALGEAHQRKPDSDLSLALVRHPDFPKKVQSIVVEFASTTEQATLD